jgi:tRNA (guanosine-2'-O-)-methyltransferase
MRCISTGVSEEAIAMADHMAVIPMSGFVESFNIAVAASLILYEARSWRMRNLGHHADLAEEDQETLLAVMLLRHQVDAYTC